MAAAISCLGLSVWTQTAPPTSGQQQTAATSTPAQTGDGATKAPAQASPQAMAPQPNAQPAEHSHKRLFIIGAVVAVVVVVAVVIASRKHTVCTSTGCTTTGGY